MTRPEYEPSLPLVLLVDNHDSFTYNLAQAMGELGADVVVRLSDVVSVQDARELEPTHVVVSPGPGRPHEAGSSEAVVQSFAGEKPVLGVCLGHQALAEVYGGRIVHAPELVHGKASTICHSEDGIFRGLSNPLSAGRYHSLVVEEASLPAELRVTARTESGLIMGLEHEWLELHGVQFHPESILTQEGKALLANFLSLDSGQKACLRGASPHFSPARARP